MTAPQPQEEYIISESQLRQIELDDYPDIVCQQIRSRPAPTTADPETCPDTCIYKRFAKNMRNANAHDTAIRNAVLDELAHKLIKSVIIDGTTEFVKFPRHAISTAIDSLRTKEQP